MCQRPESPGCRSEYEPIAVCDWMMRTSTHQAKHVDLYTFVCEALCHAETFQQGFQNKWCFKWDLSKQKTPFSEIRSPGLLAPDSQCTSRVAMKHNCSHGRLGCNSHHGELVKEDPRPLTHLDHLWVPPLHTCQQLLVFLEWQSLFRLSSYL